MCVCGCILGDHDFLEIKRDASQSPANSHKERFCPEDLNYREKPRLLPKSTFLRPAWPNAHNAAGTRPRGSEKRLLC